MFSHESEHRVIGDRLQPWSSEPSSTPLVGVVVPAYNAGRWVAETLASLQAQTWTRWVCVVVDDGSSDDTAEIVDSLVAVEPRLSLVRQANAGLPGARNAGLGHLPGECDYIGFLDSDDLYRPDALELLVEALRARPDAVGAYGLADYLDDRGRPLDVGVHPARQRDRRQLRGRRLRTMSPAEDSVFADLVVYGPIWPPAVSLHRACAVHAVGGFDPAFGSQEDWDFYVRMGRAGPYVAVDRELAWYRRHAGNMTRQHADSVFFQDLVRAKTYRSPDNTPVQARQVARAWRYLEARQAALLGWHATRALLRRDLGDAGTWAIGALICVVLVLRPGPPQPGRRRLRFTRPARLPGAAMFADEPVITLDPAGH